MSTAAAFPGLNSFLKRENRTRLLHYEEVQLRLLEAERLLHDRLGLRVNFHELFQLDTKELYSQTNVALVAVAVIAIQVGTWDKLTKVGPTPDWIIGCSLGDLTKAIVTGVCTFETAVNIPMVTLANNTDINRLGQICSVTTSRTSAFSAEDLEWFLKQGLDVSRMSNRMMTVSGRYTDLEGLPAMAAKKRWRVAPIVEFPIHSRYLNHYDATVEEIIGRIDFQEPRTDLQVYSSMNRRPIRKGSEFRSEFAQLMTSLARLSL
jgi:[acyl-carrier-protein] S-malonyltransferase